MTTHLNEESIEVVEDVKFEVMFGLLLSLIGSVLLKAPQARNYDLIHSYQTKTMEQVIHRKNFRNVARTRGCLIVDDN